MIQHKSVLNSLDNVQKNFSVKAGYFTTQRYSKHYQLVCMCLIQFRPPNHLGIQYFFSKNEIKCNRTNHITCSLIKTILSLSLPPPPIWKKSRFIGCPLPPKFPPGRLPSSSWEQLTYLVGKRVGRPQNLDMSILKVVVEKAKGAPHVYYSAVCAKMCENAFAKAASRNSSSHYYHQKLLAGWLAPPSALLSQILILKKIVGLRF